MKCPRFITSLTRSMIIGRRSISGVSVSNRGTGIISDLRRTDSSERQPYTQHVLIDASVTESLVTFATHVVNDLGLAGVALLIVMSQVVIVPGTEVTMLFAGFAVDQGHM